MPKAIPSLTLLQEDLTLTTRSRISEILLLGQIVRMNPHDVHITSLELTHISKLLDNIPLGMDGVLGEPTALRARTNAVRRNAQNLSTLHQHRNVETRGLRLSHSHSVWIFQKPLQERVIGRTNRACHSSGGKGCLTSGFPAFQFFTKQFQKVPS